jgi:hypothetical protein
LAIFGRPVNARAAFSAIITASVPELVKRSWSTDGNRDASNSANSISDSVGSPNADPNASCRVAASTRIGWA